MSSEITDPGAETITRPTIASSLIEERGQLTATLDPDVREGVRFGNYMLERKLGSGGMGEVYAATHLEAGDVVALKTLSRVSATHIYRFKREFRALADVAHDNLIKLFELGVGHEGRTFFTMELLDGEPFSAWARRDVVADGLPDLARLETALRQLVAGVMCLHDNGCVHRDLKPSNVLVTPSGRVVILDFGLISEVGEPEHGVTRDGQLLGTPIYMAPEQALAEPAGPSADFYAVGVMLYECLTGKLPHTGSLKQLLADKQRSLHLDASFANVPERWRDLCVELLERDPKRRLDGNALMARLDAGASGTNASASGEVFVGRHEELAKLHEAYAELVCAGPPIIVHLRGRSGQGKSTLMRQFRAQLRNDARCLIFHGRCRERETVPFKGVDAIVDALSAHLRRLPAHELATLRPRSVGALVQMFPVLDDLWPNPELRRLSPRELRGVSWAALREVIGSVASQRPVVLHIDDFQWADVDSVQLLHSLLRPPDAPALLLVLALRDDVGESDVLRELAASEVLCGSASKLELGPLREADARELVRRLVPPQRQETGGKWAETIVLRSGGIPMLIAQLAQEPGSTSADVDLDTIVARRLAALDQHARRLLEVVAVSGEPLATGLALELCPGATTAHVEMILADGLLVEGHLSDSGARLETAHDRIREVAQAGLAPSDLAQLHTDLGEALLRQCDRHPRGEQLFRIVDQLDAGIIAFADLHEDRRLELARLNREAGELALQTASHALAFGYFTRARELVTPWIAEASRGGGEHELCVAIMFGCLRAAQDVDESTRVFDEVIGWTLGRRDYGPICVEQMLTLFNHGSRDEALALSMRALEYLGIRLPRRATLVWALWQLLRGQRALTKLGSGGLTHLREAPDDDARAQMGTLARTGNWWAVTSAKPLRGVGLLGLHAQLVAKHGFHDAAAEGLMVLTLVLLGMGKTRQALAVWEALSICMSRWPMSPSDRASFTADSLTMFSPHREPFHAIAARIRDEHRQCLELGHYRQAVRCLSACAALHSEADTPLPQIIALVEEMQSRMDRVVDTELERSIEQTNILFRVLIEGRERLSAPDPDSFTMVPAKCAFTMRRFWIDVMFDDYSRAWDVAKTYLHNYERALMGYYHTPLYAAVAVIVMAERGRTVSGRERRRMRRLIRKCRETTARWADNCPANYAPMLALIDAETAAFANDMDEAVRSYERARTLAAANRMLWVSGLASHRLAIQARRHGYSLFVEAALRAARDTYDAWGAAALVRHLDGELA